MAVPTLNIDDMQIHPSLVDKEDVEPLLHGHLDTDWSDDCFGKVPIWSVNLLDDNQILQIGESWLADITNGTITARTAVNGLKLALSIRSMIPENNKYLLHQQARPVEMNNDFKERDDLPDIDEFGEGIYQLRASQIPVGQAPEEAPADEKLPMVEDNDRKKRDSYCFLAFYMMRLIVKSSINLINATKNMKMRYAVFYGPSRIVSQFAITIPKANAYKEALLGQDLISLTFTHALANTQQYHSDKMTSDEFGVINYLGFLVFTYSGMHTYTLMLKLKKFANISLRTLLWLFYCDITSLAIDRIIHIANHVERTKKNPTRSILFRYSTLWGPNYFSAVRSKNSVHLLYTVACAWNILTQGKENAGPENIAAVCILTASMKQTLKNAGKMIGEALKKRMLGDAHASAASALAIQQQVAPPQEDEIPEEVYTAAALLL